MIKRLTLLICLIGAGYTLSAKSVSDSLVEKSYDYLYNRIEDNAGNKAVWNYLKAYMDKAKSQNDWEEIYNGYKNYLYESPAENRLFYTDSLVYAAEKTDNNELIGDAYLTRGVIHYNLKNHIKALDNYIIANRYIATIKNDYLKFKTKYNIALIKYYLGYYNEALSLLLECTGYFIDSDQMAYANCLHNLALTYNRLGKIEQSVEQNSKALNIAEIINYSEILPHIVLLQGVNHFYSNDYHKAIAEIQQSLRSIDHKTEFAALAVGYFHLGDSYWALGNKGEAIKYFELMDKVVAENNYIRPDLRPAYDKMLEYFQDSRLIEKELVYIKKLLRLDKEIEANFKYLSKKIHKGYDTFTLTESKAKIERELSNRKTFLSLAVVALIFLGLASCYLAYSHFRLRKKYRQRFEEFLQKKEEPVLPSDTPISASLDISEDVALLILKKLDDFENNKGFIKKEITAESLAKSFDTNSKYLTKVIHHFRNKNFKAYLNDLRINYIVAVLQESPRIRNYTNAAIAGEAGYSTAQHFTRAFIAKIRMPPSFFIQEIQKLELKKTEEVNEKNFKQKASQETRFTDK